MAGRFRWFLARCQQSQSGYWRVTPSVALPQGTFLRYFGVPGRPDIALVRIWHADPAQLDAIAAAFPAADLARLQLTRTWNQVKSSTAAQRLVAAFPEAANIPNGWTLSQVVDWLVPRLTHYGGRDARLERLPFMGGDAIVEE